MNTIGYFEIQSSDPKRDIAFYQTVFGWSFVRDPHIPIEYYRIKTSGMTGGLFKRPAKTPPLEFGRNAFTCSIHVANFDETAAAILANGGKMTLPKFPIPNECWQGYFLDLDNNAFGIFQADEKAA